MGTTNEGFLKEIHQPTWWEVFEYWMEGEEHQEIWQRHAKERGFSSVREWRMQYVEALSLNIGTWTLFEIIDPLANVPQFIGGPFNAWVKSVYGGKRGNSFKEILKNPKKESNQKIADLILNFPEETILIGLVFKGQIIIVEGMHRWCALTVMSKEGIHFGGKVKIALKKFTGKEIPILPSFKKEK